MKILTAAEMREVDRKTIEQGIPGIVLMENAAHRVVEFLAERFAPLSAERVVVLCGKGNNGGDGLAIARQLHTRLHPQELHVVLLAAPEDLKGDAAANYQMLAVCGCPVAHEIPAEARNATLVIDALLGTGIAGAATGRMLEAIREINSGFPLARVVAVDIPSGMPSDSGEPMGEFARADCTVTFTAPKVAQVLPPNCDPAGELIVGAIGSPPELYDHVWLSQVEPEMFRGLLAPRQPDGHKGTFGHVLVVAGSRGKTGAAAMAGIGALRAGAGLVTVASAASAIASIAAHAPELMTEPLRETPQGTISRGVHLESLTEGKTVVAMGPGMGRGDDAEALVLRLAATLEQPMVLDADALAGDIYGDSRTRVLTPHPGEMARLSGKTTAEIQKDRVGAARDYATERKVTLVLKGHRTVIAFPDGRVWINPTGSPAMGTGGSGDVLTGMIAGFLAQFPKVPDVAVAAAVYLHGLAGEIGARALGEKCLIASDILEYLPDALEECADLSDGQ
ncbi:MAG TPA: NAD(P)H-hydrate dehydratase [Candidatus Sulfopaludibacter sp.]|nr:NAD(P)H-hydrate dehydratase [Candidatus Sulfopaludibacter sp.]